jgi:hypothetical protein
VKTIVLSAPGREDITRSTLIRLEGQNAGEPFELFRGTGRGGIADFWSMLRYAAGAGEELLALEDDIVTARNFLRFAARWRAPYMTSFFFLAGGGLRTGRPEDPCTFGGNQALWFPADLVGRVAAATPPAASRLQDDALGAVLSELGEKVIYHRSLVQHTGTVSLCQPGRTLNESGRLAADFVGEAFDCRELLRSF